MSDAFIDNMERTLENGDIPQKVYNRQILAAIRVVYEKQDDQGRRITALENFKIKMAAYGGSALFFWGVILSILNKFVF